MPRILEINAPTVEPSGAPSGDFEHIPSSPEMFGGFGAQAEEKIGGGLAKAGSEALGALTEYNDKINLIHGASVNAWYADKASDKWQAFSQLKGEASLRAQPQFKADLEDLRKQAMAQAPSLQEQTALAQSLRSIQDGYYRYSATHAATQANAYATKTAGDSIATYANLASIAYMNGDTNGFETNLRKQDNEVRNFSEHQGMVNPQDIEADVTKRRGTTLKVIIETQADTDPTAAAVLFSKYKEQMDPESRLAVMNKLAAPLRQQTYEIGGNLALGRSPAPGTFSAIERETRVPQGYTARTIQLESGGDPDARAGSHVGLVQGDAAWNRRYGVTDPGNVTQATNALLHEAQDNTAQLAGVIGRQPTASELYLAHQQGPGGAAALLENPDRPAWQAIKRFYGSEAVAQQAIWGNMSPSMRAQFPGGVTTVSAGDFANLWAGRYSRASVTVPLIDKAEAYKRADEWFGNDPAMWRGVKTVIDREYNFQETVNAQRRGELQATVPGIIADVRDGDTDKALPPDVGLLGSVASAKLHAEYDSAYREGQARRTMIFASPEEIEGLRSSLASGPGSDEFRRRDLTSFDKAVQERDKLIFGTNGKGGDPAAYVQMYPGVAALRQGLDPKKPETFDAYINASLALQDHLGVAPSAQHVLSRDEADKLTTSITQPGADAKAILDQAAQTYGNHYQGAFHDMVTYGKLSPSYQLVGALDPKNASVLSRWLQGTAPNEKGEAKTADEILGEAGGKSVGSSIRLSIRSNSALTDLQHSWADFGFSPEQIKGLSSAVEDLAYAKSLYERADPSTAATGAVDAIAGKYSLWSGQGSARVPTEVNDVVRRNAAKVLNDLKEGDLQMPAVYGAAPEGQSHIGWATSSDYLRLIKATPYWVTSPDGKGLMLKDSYLTGSLGRIVNGKNGSPIFIPFNAPLMEDAPNLPAEGASRDTPLGFAEQR